MQDDAIARALDDLPLVLADGDVEATEVAFSGGDIGECRPFLCVDGGDGGVEIVARSLQVGLGGFELREGGVASEGGEFEIALGGESLFEEFFGSVEVEARGVGGGFGGGDALLSGVDGLAFGEFLLGDLCDEGFHAALREIASAFDGFALGFEVVDEVGVIVFDFDDDLTFFHALPFDDVKVFDPSGDLRLDVGASVEGVERDDATGAYYELAPREEEDPCDEQKKDERDGLGESGGEARGVGEGGDREGDVAVENGEGGGSRGHGMCWLRR